MTCRRALHALLLAGALALALLVFAWAGLLGPGDTWAYGLICVLSGFALGADLALPPSLRLRCR